MVTATRASPVISPSIISRALVVVNETPTVISSCAVLTSAADASLATSASVVATSATLPWDSPSCSCTCTRLPDPSLELRDTGGRGRVLASILLCYRIEDKLCGSHKKTTSANRVGLFWS
ncbi:hypothetical protein P691DRAFT_806615 [Macrolepiota fuliginosa MF-IS2]|uniref:Uncharacterized protein n=1 Tax=Macrolepiota fuliginosa MF-IS2 TaxID=1400762 RepID=A0A9P5X7J8_9AGAR|nr:hypothetical protein P691DRAFT_806615 [Macrolepiota fuliginosa MF-IS2]